MTRESAGYALQGWAVMALRGDSALGVLLFRDRPAVSSLDLRIYQDDAELPDSAVRETLPRIVVAYMEVPWAVEQESADILGNGDVTLIVNVLAEAEQRNLADALMGRARDILVSTPVSGPSIIGGRLVPQASLRPVREVAFRNAWRLQQEFRSAQVGVLA